MDDMHHHRGDTTEIQRVIDLLNRGDASVRGELMNIAHKQLVRLTGQIQQELNRLDSRDVLDRPSDQLFDNVSSRLYEDLHDAVVKDARHFYQLASHHIRRELVKICRQAGSASDELTELARFHDWVDKVPGDAKEVFELIWYHEMKREEVADLLRMPVSRVRRLWRSARLELHGRMDQLASDENDIKFAGDSPPR